MLSGQEDDTVKEQLRTRFKRLREELLPHQVKALSAAICRRLAEWPFLAKTSRAMTYLAFRNELDLSALVETLPHIRWIIPRVQGQRLILHAYDPERLIRHRFGMLEPAADLPTIAPKHIDIVLVPGVAFDRQGGRLGFGGGFYDRFLTTTPAVRVGIAYDSCLVDKLPIDEHDQQMDWIVTPSQQVACTRTMAPKQP